MNDFESKVELKNNFKNVIDFLNFQEERIYIKISRNEVKTIKKNWETI